MHESFVKMQDNISSSQDVSYHQEKKNQNKQTNKQKKKPKRDSLS
jgi:hypothetical protein